MKKNLLIIGSSQGVYGGIEAYMIALAEAASSWEEFDVKLCFKIIEGADAVENLVQSAEAVCKQVYFVRRGSKELVDL